MAQDGGKMLIQLLSTQPILFFRIIVIIIFSIILHELAHGWVAITQGDDTPQRTGHLTLNPVVHMGWSSIIFLCIAGIAWGQMPVNPEQFRHGRLSNILVSGAGPLSNLLLFIVFIILLKVNISLDFQSLLSSEFLFLAARINLTLCLFNLLPIPPLDGFHIWSEVFPPLKVLNYSNWGMFILIILFTTGFSTNLYWLVNTLIDFIL